MRTPLIILLPAVLIGAATAASSQSAQSGDRTPDPAWKVPEVIAFIAPKEGDKVADIVGNHLTACLARTVGPTGTVYAIETAQVAKLHPELLERIKALAERLPNIV